MNSYYLDRELTNNPQGEYDLFRYAIVDLCENKEAVRGIEIGVYNGNTSAYLLSLNPNIHLTGIDPMVPDSMEPSMIGEVKQIKANTSQYGDRFTFIENYSENVFNLFPAQSVDFIFIDGSHYHHDVLVDYEFYFDSIKTKGLIFFHDSRMNRQGANFHPGSSMVVDEIIADDRRVQLIGEAFSLTCFIKK